MGKKKDYRFILTKKQAYRVIDQVDEDIADILIKQMEICEEYKETGNEKEYFKLYYQAHKKEIAKQQKEYRVKNYNEVSKRGKEWRKKHPDKVKEYNKRHEEKRKLERKLKRQLKKKLKRKEAKKNG